MGATNGRGATFVVDPTMYAGSQPEPSHVYGDLDRVVRTDLFYHYSTPICAQRWLDVCADPEYGHDDLMRRVDRVLPDAVEALRAEAGASSAVSVVSLGTGDGEFDSRILRGLMERMRVTSYCGMDFSFELLRRAVHRVSQAVEEDAGISVRASCGDFTDASACKPDVADEGVVRLFALTGFTLGNYSERTLLSRVRAMMSDRDYLFLDARLHALGAAPSDGLVESTESRSVLASYDRPSVRRFVFGPVEVATHATAEDVRIDFQFARQLTSVPNAMNIVIRCHDLETTMRLTGQPVRRDSLDLAITTCYSLADLLPWLEQRGFRVAWHHSDDEVALMLLGRG